MSKEKYIEIEGVMYQKRHESAIKISPRLYPILIMAEALGGLAVKTPNTPQVDLVEEYKLILKKKSRLSANERCWVVNYFNSNFKRVYAGIRVGMTFTGTPGHFTGKIEVMVIDEANNKLRVGLTQVHDTFVSNWNEDWDLQATKYGLEQGIYYLKEFTN